MGRRAFVAGTLAFVTAPPPLASEAQLAGKIYLVGVLDTGSQAASAPRVEALWKGVA